MWLCIKRFEENPDGQTMVLGRYNGYQQAKLALKEILATYPKSGRNDEHDRWWAHDAAGKKFKFVIEPEGAA